MPLQWVKSNWTILTLLGFMVLQGYDAVQEQKSQGHDIVEIRQQMDERAAVADKRYAEGEASEKANNLPNRVAVLEQQQKEFREMFRQFQEGQVAQAAAFRDGFANLTTEVRVVSSKVDDLRETRPQKTSISTGG